MEQLQFKITKKEKPAPHEKAYWAELISDLTGKPIERIFGLTRNWPLEMIKDSYLIADSKNTLDSKRKYWWWYRKQTGM